LREVVQTPRYALVVVAAWLILVSAMTLWAGSDEPVLDSARPVSFGPGGRFRAATERPHDLVLAREIEQPLGDLERCRVAAGRAAGIAWQRLAAGKLALRWMILPSGRTGNALVLDRGTTDRAIVTCVRQCLDGWRFPPTREGAVMVEYEYSFAEPPRS
jgi:hypothetical protein